MGQFQTADRNGNAYNFDDNAVGGNRAVTTIPADSAGNKALLAPGGTAWQVSSGSLPCSLMAWPPML